MIDPPAQGIWAAIEQLERQRPVLGDALVDAAIAPLKAKLQPPRQVLRRVTVLFLDVVGSTRFGSDLTPEETHEVMDGALAACADIVQRHHGKVLQYAGDSLLAVFGAEEVHEDDAECGVRAGLALVTEGRRQAGELRQRYTDREFGFRIGLHTGEVLLGGGVDGEGTIRGLTVNLAARMEQTAPTGGLRISEATQREVRGLFITEAQAPLRVKGHEQALTTYLVQGEIPHPFGGVQRGVEGVRTDLVGRDRELRALLSAAARRDRGWVAITMVGEAGIGKTRLLQEFERSLPGVSMIRGAARRLTAARPYALLGDILARLTGMSETDPMAAAQENLEIGLAQVLGCRIEEAGEVAHPLGHLLGLEYPGSPWLAGVRGDPLQVRSKGFQAAAALLRRAGRSLLLLEDLHWADAGSLDLVEDLAREANGLPMLVLSVARPELYERRPTWGSAMPHHERLDLAPLSQEDRTTLADALVRPFGGASQRVLDFLGTRSNGNPYYMEELLRMLLVRQAPQGQGTIFLDVDDDAQAMVPPTLTGILQARVDALPLPERRALQRASILGSTFREVELAAVDDEAPGLLPSLVRRGLLENRSGSPGSSMAVHYAFSHALLQGAVYETLLRQERRGWHGRLAEWLERTRTQDGAGADVIAEHLQRAGEASRAARQFAIAADFASSRYAHEDAIAHANRGLALVESSDRENRWRLLAVKEQCLSMLGQTTAQAAVIDELRAFAESCDDDARRGDVALRQCTMAMRTGDWAEAEAAAVFARDCGRRAGDASTELIAWQRQAVALSYLGRPDQGKALAEAGLIETTARLPGEIEVRFLSALAIICGQLGELHNNLKYHERSLEISRRVGSRRGVGLGAGNVGIVLVQFGQNERARRLIEEGLQFVREQNDRAMQPFLLGNLADLLLRADEPTRALEAAGLARDIACDVGFQEGQIFALRGIGLSLLALGRDDEAMTALEEALALARELDDPDMLEVLGDLAIVAIRSGRIDTARGAAEELVEHVEHPPHGDASITGFAPHCLEVLRAIGDPRADAVLNRAHNALQAKCAAIDDAELRRTFLEGVPHNRFVADVWRTRKAV